MSLEQDYRDRIGTYDRKGLLRLWEHIEAGDTPDWQPGRAFEYLVLRAFELEGATVRWPYVVNFDGEDIEQIDGVVYTNGLACLIETKDQSKNVDVAPIAKLRNQLLRRPASSIGVLFSRTEFTTAAITLACFLAPQTVLLWTGREIRYAIGESRMISGLIRKFRDAVELGLPNLNIEGLE